MESDPRQECGQTIAHIDGQIKRVDDQTYTVHSQTSDEWYDVLSSNIDWMCSCPDYTCRGVKCKHIWAVEFSNALRNQVLQTQTPIIQPLVPQVCIYCGSESVVKHGVRHNAYRDIQRFTCRACDKRFVRNLGFEKIQASPQVVTGAMQLYFSGESLRNVQKFLSMQGVQISHQTVYNWIRKYVVLMERYLDKIKPQVSDTWRADEMFLKIKGNPKYLYALMDDQTRFWIAQEVGGDKWRFTSAQKTARELFSQGQQTVGRRPNVLITDGLPAYRVACPKLWWTQKNPCIKHIRHITFKGDYNNNKMERMNGEVRDREKVLRGLKKENSPVLKAYQLYHNYIRPHEGLKGKTPAEVAGIDIQERTSG